MNNFPQRIICMTEETTETIYLLGEQDRIVGISGYTVRPEIARKEKPRISAFTRANIKKILALEPDLVLGFSDMQADIAAKLIRAGIAVHIFNQRSVDGIFKMITLLGNMLGVPGKTEKLVKELRINLDQYQSVARTFKTNPVIYFEEWDEPLISGIGWVSELIELAGGQDCYAEFAKESAAINRIIKDPQDVVRRNPDIIIGSWCGKHFRPEKVSQRTGWDKITAVKHQHLYEIKSANILQPGPAALTDGIEQISQILHQHALSQSA